MPERDVGVKLKEDVPPVASAPHLKFPEASVSMVSQLAMVEICKPPPEMERPLAMVEEAVPETFMTPFT